MTKRPITIDDILAHFFASYLDKKTGVARRRIEQAERQLRACIEAEAPRILVEEDLRMLAAERQFNPEHAVARMMLADDLIFLMSIFVEPQWQPADRLQRSAQLLLTSKLLEFVVGRGLVSRRELACPILDIEAGVVRGRAELQREKRHAASLD
jgi:hypothetical protein